jgi:hypothetical protein
MFIGFVLEEYLRILGIGSKSNLLQGYLISEIHNGIKNYRAIKLIFNQNKILMS